MKGEFWKQFSKHKKVNNSDHKFIGNLGWFVSIQNIIVSLLKKKVKWCTF